MDLDYLHIIYEAFIGSISSVVDIAIIVIPLMIFLQFIKEFKVLEKIAVVLNPFTKLLGISKYASLPLMAGLFLGIVYGGGIIIQTARDGLLTRREMYITIIFLALCHSMFEDNFLFIAIGANPYVLFFGRFLLAVIVTFIVSRLWREGKKKTSTKKDNVDNIYYLTDYCCNNKERY